MNYNKIYQAVEQDFGHEVALLTVQMVTIQKSTKFKNIETHSIQVENKISKISKIERMFCERSQANYDIALKCWKVSYDWWISQELDDEGDKKTFRELIAKK
jgi:hypothetical protein